MKLLGELYASLDDLKKGGSDTAKLQKEIEEKENEVLQNDIIPSIKEIVDILLSSYRKDVSLVCEYKYGQGTLVYLSDNIYTGNSNKGKTVEDEFSIPLANEEECFSNKGSEITEKVSDNTTNTQKITQLTPHEVEPNKIDNTAKSSSSIPDKSNNTVETDFIIKQSKNHFSIFDKKGVLLYTSSGKVKIIGNEFYRINKTYSYLAINKIERNGGQGFKIGQRIINARMRSQLHIRLSKDFIELIEDIRDVNSNGEFILKYDGAWYNQEGAFVNIDEKKIIYEPNKKDDEKTTDNKSVQILPQLIDPSIISNYHSKSNSPLNNARIKNVYGKCFVYDSSGKIIYDTNGFIRKINDLYYRFIYDNLEYHIYLIIWQEYSDKLSEELVNTIKKGKALYNVFRPFDFYNQIKEISYIAMNQTFYIKVYNEWYNNKGEVYKKTRDNKYYERFSHFQHKSLTPNDVCEILNIDSQKLEKLVLNKAIPRYISVRGLHYFRRKDVLQYLNNNYNDFEKKV